MMTRRVRQQSSVAITLIAAGCDRTETSTAAVTTSRRPALRRVPSSDSARHRDEALVRVVHAAPSGTDFDLFAGDLLLFDGLGVQDRHAVSRRRRKAVRVRAAPRGHGQAKPLSSNTEDLKDGDFYTAFAMPGDGNGPQPARRQRSSRSPASGKARLRVVHAGVDAGTIDVRAAGAPRRSSTMSTYQSVTDYRDVAPLNGAIEIVGAGQVGAAARRPHAHLEAGRFYTLVIVGNAARTDKVEAFLIEDALSP